MRAILSFGLWLVTLLNLIWAQDISVTVTNQDVALVREERQISLQPDEFTFELTDLPARIDPTSVFIDPGKNKFRILEQNFEYDLLSAEKILQKAAGLNIRLINPDGQVVSGTLLQSDNNDIVLRTASGEIMIMPRRQDYQIAMEMTGDDTGKWVTQPTLRWRLAADNKGIAEAKISYLTSGLNWHTEYIANLSDDEKSMSLAAWVSVDNNSGKTYTNAHLRLIAGDIHLIEKMQPRLARGAKMYELMDTGFQEQEFFEYHLYNLQRNTTLGNNQTKQIELFPTVYADVKKAYRYNYQDHPKKVSVLLNAMNSKKNGLGIPLPMGVVRMYKEAEKDQIFIGEDRIDHTAVDEKLELQMGKAFDIAASRTVTNQAMVGKNSEEQTILVEINNHKKEDIQVLISEPIPPGRSYKIIKSDLPVDRQDATKVEFLVPVSRQGSRAIQFEILYSW